MPIFRRVDRNAFDPIFRRVDENVFVNFPLAKNSTYVCRNVPIIAVASGFSKNQKTHFGPYRLTGQKTTRVWHPGFQKTKKNGCYTHRVPHPG